MSKKHVEQYYNEICDQYMEMQQNIKDFEQIAMEGMIEPERLDEIKKNIEPLMVNYERISYIMYLLNKPNKKEKLKVYEKQNKKILKKLNKNNSLENTLNENTNCINTLKETLHK